jgi:hypothetical protein
MASCLSVEPRPVGSVYLGFEICLAPKGRMAVRQGPAKSTGLAASDQETQESSRALCSRLERYAGRRPKSSARGLIDCEEDRTLRAVLIGILRETFP